MKHILDMYRATKVTFDSAERRADREPPKLDSITSYQLDREQIKEGLMIDYGLSAKRANAACKYAEQNGYLKEVKVKINPKLGSGGGSGLEVTAKGYILVSGPWKINMFSEMFGSIGNIPTAILALLALIVSVLVAIFK